MYCITWNQVAFEHTECIETSRIIRCFRYSYNIIMEQFCSLALYSPHHVDLPLVMILYIC